MSPYGKALFDGHPTFDGVANATPKSIDIGARQPFDGTVGDAAPLVGARGSHRPLGPARLLAFEQRDRKCAEHRGRRQPKAAAQLLRHQHFSR